MRTPILSLLLLGLGASSSPGQEKPAPEGMVWIPGGVFQMGSSGEFAWPDEGPVHAVRVHGCTWCGETGHSQKDCVGFALAAAE